MPPPKTTMTLGADATVSVLSRFIHPLRVIDKAFPNRDHKHRLEGMRALRTEVKKVRRKEQKCIIFTSNKVTDDNSEPIELYACGRFVKITEEGPPELFFDARSKPRETGEEDENGIAYDDNNSTGTGNNDNDLSDDEKQEMPDQVREVA